MTALRIMRPPITAPAAIPPFAPAERPIEEGLFSAGGETPAQKNDPPTLDSLDSLCRGEQSSGCEL